MKIFKITEKNGASITYQSESELDWTALGHGKPERWLQDSPMSPLSEEEKAKAIDSRKVVTVEAKPASVIQVQKELEDGSVEIVTEVIPAVEEQFYMEYKFAAEYDLEVKDITAEVKAEKQAKEAKKLAKEKRKDDRKKLDWSKINSIAELKAIVKSLVEELED